MDASSMTSEIFAKLEALRTIFDCAYEGLGVLLEVLAVE